MGEVTDGRVVSTLYRGPKGFAARPDGERCGDIYQNRYLTVKGVLCEHRIAVLAFRVTEGEAFVLDQLRMAQAGVVQGKWLKVLEKLFHTGKLDGSPIVIPEWVGNRRAERREPDAAALYRRIMRREAPASIGYVTDIGFSTKNLERLTGLLGGVTLLVCECAFLAADEKKARISRHFCTSDLNIILDRLRPRYLLPMHLSKSYQGGNSQSLYREIEPPPGVTVLRIPDRLTPRPIMASEVPKPVVYEETFRALN